MNDQVKEMTEAVKEKETEQAPEAKEESKKEAELEDVIFDFSPSKTVIETIKVPGVKPFQITFKVPNGVAGLDMEMDYRTDSIGAEKTASKGDAVIRLAARHLVAWSFPHDPNYESLYAIRNSDVLSAIVETISQAKIDEQGAAVKN